MPAHDLIEGYMAHLRERSGTKAAMDTYRYQLEFADRMLTYGLDSSTEEEIRAWLWRDGLKPASRALTHAAIGGFFRWAVDAGHLDFNPTTKIPRPKVPDGLPRVGSDEDVRKVVTESGQPHRLMAELAAYGGLRCIEVHRLHREHITEREMRVYGKGDKYRIVPTHPQIWESVRDLPPGPLIHLASEKMISSNFRRYCLNHFGLVLSMHRLRGWFATTMYRATKDLRAVQRLLGHANLATTARYLGLGDQELRDAISALPTLVAAGGVAPVKPGLWTPQQ